MKTPVLLCFVLFAFSYNLGISQAAGDPPANSTTTTSTTPSSNITTTTSTTTTTPKPSTTTTTVKPTPAPTPAPTPTPTPASTVLSGNVTEQNYTCIRYEFTADLSIKYNSTNGTKEALLTLPHNSVLSFPNGTCTHKEENFTLTSPDQSINLTFVFASNENSVFLNTLLISVNYTKQHFADIEPDQLNKIVHFNLTGLSPNFNVEKSHSYACANVTVPKDNTGDLQVVFSSLKLQAFMEASQNGQYSSEHNCRNEINDVVPIAVGGALTGLVIIVMIAYFIGRRRSRRLAYQSV